jgi:hypothetical protein
MLTDQILELLTAFIDGELSQRQRKAVMRLLHRSSEAREMVRQLQENAHKLKQLPRHKVEPSLVEEVLQAIAEQKAQPKPAAQSRVVRRRWLPYLAASLAASLLIGTIGALYWKSMNEKENIAKGDGPAIVKLEKKPEPQATPTRKANPMLARIIEATISDFRKPVPAEQPQVFTASFRDLLKAGEKEDQLARALDPAKKSVQFDITVKDNFVAMDRLKSALSTYKIVVVADPNAVKALSDKKQAKAEYWVYVENLTTDELTKMMQELAKNDTTGMKTSVPSPYEKVTVKPITTNDTQKIAGLLGVAPNKMEIPKGNNTKPEPMKGWRKAVLLPLSAGLQPSAQVEQFVSQRTSPQADTLRVLIKIHEVK